MLSSYFKLRFALQGKIFMGVIFGKEHEWFVYSYDERSGEYEFWKYSFGKGFTLLSDMSSKNKFSALLSYWTLVDAKTVGFLDAYYGCEDEEEEEECKND